MNSMLFYRGLTAIILCLIVTGGVANGQKIPSSEGPGRFTSRSAPRSYSPVGLASQKGPPVFSGDTAGEFGGESRVPSENDVRASQRGWIQERPANQTPPNEPDQPYRLSGRFYLQEGTARGYLILQCELPNGSYINSITLPKEHYPSEIQIADSDDYLLLDDFQADRPPAVNSQDPVFGHRTEKHFGKIQFFVPIQFAAGVDGVGYSLNMTFNTQVCTNTGSCLPVRNKVVSATFAGYFQTPIPDQSREK